MAIAGVGVVAVVVALVVALVVRRVDPYVGLGFALVLAVSGGGVLIGATTVDVRVLGGVLVLVAVMSATAVLLGANPVATRPAVSDREPTAGP